MNRAADTPATPAATAETAPQTAPATASATAGANPSQDAPAAAAAEDASDGPAGDGPGEPLPYEPAFVPTKASRLAFLATGKPAPRDLALTEAPDERPADARRPCQMTAMTPAAMSLDDAIAAERARNFGRACWPTPPAAPRPNRR